MSDTYACMLIFLSDSLISSSVRFSQSDRPMTQAQANRNCTPSRAS
jgi:hypothetical protein